MSHYLFRPHFCRIRRANEKGVVEGAVRYSRLNFLVPVPQVADWDELNAHLLTCCRSDMTRRLRGKTLTKQQLLEEDKVAGLAIPADRFDPRRLVSTTATSEALVRLDTNDYSVPVEYGHRPVVVKGRRSRRSASTMPDREIARHVRCWEREKQIFDPLHYLSLLERKPGSLDHARPLAGWNPGGGLRRPAPQAGGRAGGWHAGVHPGAAAAAGLFPGARGDGGPECVAVDGPDGGCDRAVPDPRRSGRS